MMDHESVSQIFEAGRTTATCESRVTVVESHVLGTAQGTSEVMLIDKGQEVVSLAKYQAQADRAAEKPRRRIGTATHFELKSFVDHVNRFRGEASAVWADLDALKLIAVLNYHPKGPDPHGAAWGDHRSVYACPLTQTWREWVAASGISLTQELFADFLDAYEVDILTGASQGDDGPAYPGSLDMIELARDLRVYTKGTFEKEFDRRTGTHTLICKTERGEGSTEIPRAFLVALQIFEGGARYELEARVFFTMRDARPRLMFKLHRYQDRLREAFGEIREQVAKETKLPVFAGRPESDD